MTVREPRSADVATLESAEQSCFSDPWPARFFIAELFAPARFNRVVEGGDGTLVAYLFSAWQYLDLHILKVATVPGSRRAGIGRRLMLLAEDHARAAGGESITLEVRPNNLAAIAMYDGLGFTLVGRRPSYYQDGEDAQIMTLKLQ